MHATGILLRLLAPALDSMHGSRRNVLLHAVQAFLSRPWPDATFAHAPLKALDRL